MGLGGGGRDLEPEGRTFAEDGVDADLAAHQLHHALADGQPEAGAAVGAVDRHLGLGEPFEQPPDALRRDAGAGVDHRDPQPARALAPAPLGADGDRALAGELHRVGQEVEQDLAQPRDVAADQRRGLGVELGLQLHALGGGMDGEQPGRLVDQMLDRQGLDLQLRLAGLQLGEVQHVVDDRQQGLGGIEDPPRVAARFLGQLVALAQEAREPDDRGERRPELVAHVGEKRRLGRRGRLGLDPRLVQLGLEGLGLGDVADHVDELDRLAVVAEHQGRIGFDPDPAAILVPGPVAERLGQPGLVLLDQAEDGAHHLPEVVRMDHLLGVLAAHLVGRMAEHPHRAGGHIERLAGQGGPADHVRGMVGQEAVAGLAAPGGGLGLLQLGDVATGAEARGHLTVGVELDHAAGDDVADLAVRTQDPDRQFGRVDPMVGLPVALERGQVVGMHEGRVFGEGRRSGGPIARVDPVHLVRPGEPLVAREQPPVADAGQLLGQPRLAIGLHQGVAGLDQLALQRPPPLQGGGHREGHEAGGQEEGLHAQELEGEVAAGEDDRHPAIGHEHREGAGHRQGAGRRAQELQLQGGEHQERRRQQRQGMGRDHRGQADVEDDGREHRGRPPDPLLPG